MNICPQCLFVSSHAAELCVRCGKHRFRSAAASTPGEQPALSNEVSSSLMMKDVMPAAITRQSKSIKGEELQRTTAPPQTEEPVEAVEARAEVKQMGETPSSAISYTPAANTLTGSQAARSTMKVILKPSLEVVRGERLTITYPILEGKNIIGRTVNQPADIDLTGQERVEQVWTSRQHSMICFDGRTMIIEDLKSLNGTFVNRIRLLAGQQRILHANDIIQVGTVQLRVLVTAQKVES